MKNLNFDMKFSLVKEEIEDLKNITNPEILFIGDSYFQLWRFSPLYKDYSFFNLFDKTKCLNIGVGSTKYKDWLYLLDDIKNFPKFSKIVVNLGFNDIHHTETTTAEEVYQDYLSFLDKLKTIFPQSKIYILTTVVSPLYISIKERINYFNSLVINSSKQLGIKIINNADNTEYYQNIEECFIEDGMHLNYFGHKHMCELIKEELSLSETGKIFSIEEFSTYDGPGIRTTIFLKGCPLRCEWCHNPEGQRFETEYIRSPNGCLKCNKCLDKALVKDNRTILTKESLEVCPRSLIKECGEDKTVDELVSLILKNKLIYEMNNGGVTFSGGEPLSQYNFLIETLKKLNGKIHRAIQTSGYIENDKFINVLNNVDYVLYDIKIFNTEEHIKYCGVSNQIILKNYESLVKSNIPFITRIPLIPDVIDNKENLNAIGQFLKSLGVKNIELLPYNNYAGSKYSWLLREYEFDKTHLKKEDIDYQKVFKKYNIEIKIL